MCIDKQKNMKIGDLVSGKNIHGEQTLYCGTGRFTLAIVVGTNPLVLKSHDDDMCWDKFTDEEIEEMVVYHQSRQDLKERIDEEERKTF